MQYNEEKMYCEACKLRTRAMIGKVIRELSMVDDEAYNYYYDALFDARSEEFEGHSYPPYEDFANNMVSHVISDVLKSLDIYIH